MSQWSKSADLGERTAEGRHRGGIVAASLTFLMVLTVACSTEVPSDVPSPTPVGVVADDNRITMAQVVKVVDGATVDVEIDGQLFRVRYLGIEIPEPATTGPDGANLGERARDFNSHLVSGQTVELEKGAVDTNSFGLAIRYVYVDGEMVNEALLTNGYATVASFPPDFKYKSSFELAEEEAKRERRGVWTPKSPTTGQEVLQPTPAKVKPFSGGTLPLPPNIRNKATICDYSETVQPVIKGNVDTRTGELIYHVPGGFFYSTTEVSESDGDRWFCTEGEALAAGWKRAQH